jgi:hypothetical protein
MVSRGLSIANGASNSAMIVDGSATTGSAGTNATSGAATLVADAGGNALVGNMCEGALFPLAPNSTQNGNLNTNMHSATNGWNF